MRKRHELRLLASSILHIHGRKQSGQHVSVRSISAEMVDRPSVNDNQKRDRSKTRKRSRNRPKHIETLFRNQSWKPSVFLRSGTLRAKKTKKVHWSDCDIKVVYSQEANPTQNIIQRFDTHQILPTPPEYDGFKWRLDRVPARTGTAQCVLTSEVSTQDHRSLQGRAQNKMSSKATLQSKM